MTVIEKIEYNIKSSKKYGWQPGWFGAKHFDDNLLEKITSFQIESDIDADGLVGPTTYRRIYTDRTSNLDYLRNKIIISDDVLIDVPFNVNHTYNQDFFKGCFKQFKGERTPIQVVTHWDATLSAEHCIKILKKRGISTHFAIDNDGEVFQLVNCNNIAWHASGHNNHTIGIDFSNAFYLKYQDYYIKNVGKGRPVIKSVVHGAKYEHLGYYPEQLRSYRELLDALLPYYDIPRETPEMGTLCKDAVSKKYHGVVSHYHLTKRKIDCAGLNIREILYNE